MKRPRMHSTSSGYGLVAAFCEHCRNFGFIRSRGISWLAGDVLVHQAELCSMELSLVNENLTFFMKWLLVRKWAALFCDIQRHAQSFCSCVFYGNQLPSLLSVLSSDFSNALTIRQRVIWNIKISNKRMGDV